MKKTLLTMLSLSAVITCFAQTDTLYTYNSVIPCIVKEITPEAVKYSLPEEDLINSVYKNTVKKIVLKNGRVQTFSEATLIKEVSGINDFENVAITQFEGEVKGLHKLGFASTKAKGTTTLANQVRVKERAYRKLKMQAAMMGGNIVYISDQRTEGNKYGTEYVAGSTTETSLSAIVYTTLLPDFDAFLNRIGDKKQFVVFEENELWSGGSDVKRKLVEKKFTINDIRNESGQIILNANLRGERKVKNFRVVSFSSEFFSIYYEDNSSAYNLIVQM